MCNSEFGRENQLQRNREEDCRRSPMQRGLRDCACHILQFCNDCVAAADYRSFIKWMKWMAAVRWSGLRLLFVLPNLRRHCSAGTQRNPPLSSSPRSRSFQRLKQGNTNEQEKNSIQRIFVISGAQVVKCRPSAGPRLYYFACSFAVLEGMFIDAGTLDSSCCMCESRLVYTMRIWFA